MQTSLDIWANITPQEALYMQRARELWELGFTLLHTNPSQIEETLAYKDQYVATEWDNLAHATVWRGTNPLTGSVELWHREHADVVQFRIRDRVRALHAAPDAGPQNILPLGNHTSPPITQNTLDSAA